MAKKVDLLRDTPLYSQAEASLYLNIPRSTLRYWAFGDKRDAHKALPVVMVPSHSNQLSFFNLVELHVLNSIRKDFNIVLPDVRRALKYIERELGISRPLLNQEFETDGVSLFVKKYGELINVTYDGQYVMEDILKDSLTRIKRDAKKIPIKLFPYTRSDQENSPRVICMTPSLFSGRPVIDGTGISTAVIADRYKAGDSVRAIAKDFKQETNVIEEAIRCELQKAA
jgi:uncharacterized protein (DUF433 family)